MSAPSPRLSRYFSAVFLCRRCVRHARCGVRTEIADRKTGLKFTQWCVGNISDAVRPCPWPLGEGALGDRITYTHHSILQSDHASANAGAANVSRKRCEDGVDEGGPVESLEGQYLPREVSATRVGVGSGDAVSAPSTTFAVVDILSEPADARMRACLIKPSGRLEGGEEPAIPTRASLIPTTLPTGLLGPVVGKLDWEHPPDSMRSIGSVPVLLEVDRDGVVTCVVRNGRKG